MESSKDVPRFVDSSKEDLDSFVAAAVPENTKVATSFWVGVFHQFCKQFGIVVDLNTCTAEEFCDVLCRFYRGLRTKNQTFYKKSSYLAARAAIGRHVTVDLKRPFNVFQTTALQQANRVLNAVLVENKARGEEGTVHKDAVEGEDAAKLEAYFDDTLESGDAVKLCQYSWYNITTHFALRAAEVQLQLKKHDLSFDVDEEGQPFVALKRDFLSKNAKGGLKGREFVCDGRMYGEKKIAALRLLVSKLHPDIDRVFQRAIIRKHSEDKAVWFMKSCLGHNVLRDMMPRISEAAGLSRRYTNHCLRATVVTRLKSAGYEDRQICRVTGHKNVQSLTNYDKTSAKDRREISKALDGGSESSTSTTDSSATVSSDVASPPFGGQLSHLITAKNSVLSNVVINIGEPLAKRSCKQE